MKRIAVLGATGAVGRGLIERAVRHGTEVHVLCREDSKRLANIPDSPLVYRWSCSMEQLQSFDAAKLPRLDVFYFLAWGGSFGAAARNDMRLQLSNVGYALDAVHLAERTGCKVFVGAGSQAEYGRVEGLLSEDTPCRPENGYGIAKLCAGEMTAIECRKLGIRHNWGRILSVYGPCDNPDSVIMYAIRSCRKGIQPEFTAGEQQWDYIYSEDVGEALYAIGERGKDGRVYPIGSGQTRPLRSYLEQTCRMAKPGITPLFGARPYMDGQVMHLCADIRSLSQDTGFSPKISFEEGIRRTIEWYIEEHKRDETIF